MVYGLWFMVCGIWFMVDGVWCMVYGLWFLVYGSPFPPLPLPSRRCRMGPLFPCPVCPFLVSERVQELKVLRLGIYGSWFMVCMVYGVWCMVYGVWCMVYGLWFLVYGSPLPPIPSQVGDAGVGPLFPRRVCPSGIH